MQEVYNTAKAENAEELWSDLITRPGFDINAKNPNGNTALITAAYKGRDKAVRFLLGHGADHTIRNNGGYTALMYACYRGDKNSITHLLSCGADPMHTENTGRSSIDLCNNENIREFIKSKMDKSTSVVVEQRPTETIGIEQSGIYSMLKPSEVERATPFLNAGSNGKLLEPNGTNAAPTSTTKYPGVNIDATDEVTVLVHKLKLELQQEQNERSIESTKLLSAVSSVALLNDEIEKLKKKEIVGARNVEQLQVEYNTLSDRHVDLQKMYDSLLITNSSLQIDRENDTGIISNLKSLVQRNVETEQQLHAELRKMAISFEEAIKCKEELAVEKICLSKTLEKSETLVESLRETRDHLVQEINGLEQRVAELLQQDEKQKIKFMQELKINYSITQVEINQEAAMCENYDAHSSTDAIQSLVAALESANEMLSAENEELRTRFHRVCDLKHIDNSFVSGAEIKQDVAISLDFIIAAVDLVKGLTMPYSVFGESKTLFWRQVESSLIDENPVYHLSRFQTIVIISAVLIASSKQRDRNRFEVSQLNETFFQDVSQVIVSTLGVDDDFIFDEENNPQIPVVFIIQVLLATRTGYLLLDNKKVTNILILPVAFPRGDHTTELSRCPELISCAHFCCSGRLPPYLMSILYVRLSTFYERGVSFSNFACFSSKFYHNHICSRVLVSCNEESSDVSLWVSGESHLLCYLILCALADIFAELCPISQEISLDFDQSYVAEYSFRYYDDITNFDLIAKKYVFLKLYSEKCTNVIKGCSTDCVKDSSALSVAVDMALLSLTTAYKSMRVADFHVVDATLYILHCELLSSFPWILALPLPGPHTRPDDLNTLWLLCSDRAGTFAEVNNSVAVWLVPVSPGVAPGDNWHLLSNAGICISDIDNRISGAISDVQFAGNNDDVIPRQFLNALECLGVSSSPGITVLGVLNLNIYPENVRIDLRSVLFEHQKKHFQFISTSFNVSYWVGNLVLARDGNRSHIDNIETGENISKITEEIEEIDLSALTEDLSVADRAAFSKAKMVGELSRRLTFHREKSGHNDLDKESGVVASLLKKDSLKSLSCYEYSMDTVQHILSDVPARYILSFERMRNSITDSYNQDVVRIQGLLDLVFSCSGDASLTLEKIKAYTRKNSIFDLIAICEDCGVLSNISAQIAGPSLWALLALLSCFPLSIIPANSKMSRICVFNLKSMFLQLNETKLQFLGLIADFVNEELRLDLEQTAVGILSWFKTVVILNHDLTPDYACVRSRILSSSLIPVKEREKNGSFAPGGDCCHKFVCSNCVRQDMLYQINFDFFNRSEGQIISETIVACSSPNLIDATDEHEVFIKVDSGSSPTNTLVHIDADVAPYFIEEPSDNQITVPPHGCCVIS